MKRTVSRNKVRGGKKEAGVRGRGVEGIKKRVRP